MDDDEYLPPLPTSWADQRGTHPPSLQPTACTPVRALNAAAFERDNRVRLRPTAATPVRELNAAAFERANKALGAKISKAWETTLFSTPPSASTPGGLRAQLEAVTAALMASKQELAAMHAARDNAVTPTHLRCPITLQRMRSPVVVADGHSFERHAIASWLAEHRTNPLTGATLHDTTLVPALALRDAISEWEEAHDRAPTERDASSPPPPPIPAPRAQQPNTATQPSGFLSRAMAGAGSWLTSGAQAIALHRGGGARARRACLATRNRTDCCGGAARAAGAPSPASPAA